MAVKQDECGGECAVPAEADRMPGTSETLNQPVITRARYQDLGCLGIGSRQRDQFTGNCRDIDTGRVTICADRTIEKTTDQVAVLHFCAKTHK